MAGVFTAVLFYILFKETISISQICGMFLLIVSVVLVALEGAESDDQGTGSKLLKLKYCLLAILFGLSVPVLNTVRAYFVRVSAKKYKAWDLAVDSIILENLIYAVMFVMYLKNH